MPKLLSASALFGQAWEIYKKRWGTLTVIVLIPFIILTVVVSLSGVFVAAFMLPIVLGVSSFSPILLVVLIPILVVVSVILGLLVQAWSQTALVYAIKDREENIGVIESYRRARKKVFSYLWVVILSGLVVVGGMILLVVPGIIFMVWISFGLVVVVMEDQKGLKALLVSREYVRGNWGGVLWRLIFVGLCSMIVSFGASFLIEAVLKSVAIPYLLTIVSTLINAVINAVITCFAVTYVYSLYSNLKSLKGGSVVVPEKNDKGVLILVAIIGLILIPGTILLNVFFLSFRSHNNKTVNYQPPQVNTGYSTQY